MPYISAQVKVNATSQRISLPQDESKEIPKIDRTETSFGGKGCLTEEQYEEGMSLFREMQHMSAW